MLVYVEEIQTGAHFGERVVYACNAFTPVTIRRVNPFLPRSKHTPSQL
jgi:hypothetical protein